jgi:cyclophilin family peptidyl-prolyl cis-trans isomerase
MVTERAANDKEVTRMRRVQVARKLLFVMVLLVCAAWHDTPTGAAQTDCGFTLGFKALRDQIPTEVGACLENERFNPLNGNAEQRTSGGLLVWRKADNWTAFTNGATTGLNGPDGLASRPNDGPRFPWEVAAAAATSTPTGRPAKQYPQPPAMTIDASRSYQATIETNLGTLQATLFPQDAPNTVNNFVFLAREHFYDGVPFHRIIANFMVQTGDPTGTGRGGPGYRFADELPRARDYETGTLAMANAGPNTQGSQFFIVHARPKATLPKNYTIFGKLTAGLDTLDRIAATPVEQTRTGELSLPTQDVHIVTVTIREE